MAVKSSFPRTITQYHSRKKSPYKNIYSQAQVALDDFAVAYPEASYLVADLYNRDQHQSKIEQTRDLRELRTNLDETAEVDG